MDNNYNYTLGLDLGASSIGWAAVDLENNYIIDMGSRVFPAGVENMNSSKEQSLNVSRREARSARVRLERRKMRKQYLWTILTKNGFVQNTDHFKEDFFQLDPYKLRSQACRTKVSLEEFARILYNLCQRRGYKDISDATKKDDEKGAIFEGKDEKPGIMAIRGELESGKYKTLGEYLASLDTSEIRIRNRYTERSMYENEFEIIWNIQAKHHQELTQALKDRIQRAIFFQRPLRSQKKMLGKCKFEPQHAKCAKSNPRSQLFRMYQQINILTISSERRYTDDDIELTAEEKDLLINYLINNGDIKLGKKTGEKEQKNKEIAKILGLDKALAWHTNLDTIGILKGCSTNYRIRKAVNKNELNLLNESVVFDLWHIVYSEKDFDHKVDLIKNRFSFSGETAEKLAKLKFEAGYSNVSSRAMKKILPWLQEGLKYHEAVQNAGYNHHSLLNTSDEILDKLPIHSTTRNPIVDKSIHDLRRVVNTIIERYGKPNNIIVEMARDLGKSKDDRTKILADNKKKEEENKNAKETIEKFFETNSRDKHVTKQDIVKYRLWKNQQEICVYSGKPIPFADLWNGYVDVDHILPLSKTLDDSFTNKVVVYRSENAIKTNKTPFQAFSSDKNKWEGILERAYKLGARKYKYIKMNEQDFEKHIGENVETRLLNDTRYISRFAKDYLKQICKNVNVSNGSLTFFLRKYWGINHVLDEINGEKNREDHRHHAIDAVVLALSNRSQLQRLSTFFGKINREYYDTLISEDHQNEFFDAKGNREKFQKPWENFVNDLTEKVACIIVSYKINKFKTSGALHEETSYGRRKNADGEPMTDALGVPQYYVKKPITSLNIKQMSEVVDIKIREQLMERLEQCNINPKDTKAKIPQEFFTAPFYIGKTRIRTVRISVPSNTMKKIGTYNKYVEPGSNHHMVVYKDTATGKQGGKVVTTFDAANRKANGFDVVNKQLGEEKEFICSIRINDLISTVSLEDYDLNNKANYKQFFNNIYQITGLVQDGRVKGKIHYFTKSISAMKSDQVALFKLEKSINTLSFTKLSIDPLGYISIAND